MRSFASLLLLGLTVLSAGCDRPQPAVADHAASNLVEAVPANAGGAAAGFQPLQSDAVKDAMHRALKTGQTQRWEDAGLSGYAVPGPPGKNGCRAIRYTVDQRPEVPFESITACEASGPAPS